MATLSDVRDGLAATIQDATGVTCHRVPVDDIDPPSFIVAGFQLTPSTLEGGAVVTAEVYAAVARIDYSFIDQLDSMVAPTGDTSAWAAIQADTTLGGLVDSAIPVSVTEYRELVMGDVGYYAATLTVEVLL